MDAHENCGCECCDRWSRNYEGMVDQLCEFAKRSNSLETHSILQLLKRFLQKLIALFSSGVHVTSSTNPKQSGFGQRIARIYHSHFGESPLEGASNHDGNDFGAASHDFSTNVESDSIGGINILEPQSWQADYDFSGLDPDNSDTNFTSDYDFGSEVGSGWDSDGFSFGGSTDGGEASGGSDQGGGSDE